MDKITEQRISLLHPKVRDEVRALIELANKVTGNDITIRVVQGLRTVDEQNALYAQGRTAPGPKVTNAKGGQSYHNYGLAIDFAFLIKRTGEVSWDERKDWDGDKIADWLEVVQIFVKAGWIWGGTFKANPDTPHFEKTFGLNWRDMLVKYNANDFITGTKYINI
jgi:peptidoglycan L-alanyl-D-glutamate endopeptidase CwlK